MSRVVTNEEKTYVNLHRTVPLSMFDICTDVHFDSHITVRMPIVDTYVFG